MPFRIVSLPWVSISVLTLVVFTAFAYLFQADGKSSGARHEPYLSQPEPAPSGPDTLSGPVPPLPPEPLRDVAPATTAQAEPQSPQSTANQETVNAADSEAQFRTAPQNDSRNDEPEQYYLSDDEFTAVQSTLINAVMDFPPVEQGEEGNGLPFTAFGFEEDQLELYGLLASDIVTAINHRPLNSLLGDGAAGSVIAGPLVEFDIRRGDQQLSVIISQY